MKLLDYIKGVRKGKEAHRLEKEAMSDPFLADALDGYNGVKGNHESRIEDMRRQIRSKSGKKKSYTAIWSMAASILIGVCISGYFLFQNDPSASKHEEIALESEQSSPLVTPKEEIRAEIIHKDTVEKAASLIAKNELPEVPASVPVVEIAKQSAVVEEKKELVADATLMGPETTQASSHVVRGKVTDRYGDPLIGASVSVKGTAIATVTDLDGSFSLDMGDHDNLQVDYIGYDPVKLPIDTTSTMLIAMHENSQSLDEVVVIGYGTQKKTSITASVRTKAHAKKTHEKKPRPVTGMKAFKKYLKENRIRPEDAECELLKGKVILTFRVDEDGRPDSITVKKGLCPSLEEEAIRLIEEGPDWTPEDGEAEITIRF